MLALALLFAAPAIEPGAVIYALDPAVFARPEDGPTPGDRVARRLSYVIDLGATAVWVRGASLAQLGDLPGALRDSETALVLDSTLADAPAAARVAQGLVFADPAAREAAKAALKGSARGIWLAAGGGDSGRGRSDPGPTLSSAPAEALLAFVAGRKTALETAASIKSEAGPLGIGLIGTGRAPVALTSSSRQAEFWCLYFALPGLPIIDSGSEAGLRPEPAGFGARDPWDPSVQAADVLGLVRTLVQLRRARPSLYQGSWTDLAGLAQVDGDDVAPLVFARTDRFETTLVVASASNKPETVRIPAASVGGAALHVLAGSAGLNQKLSSITVTLDPHGFALLGA